MGQPDITSRLRELSRPTGEEDLLTVRYPQPRFRVPMWQALAVGCVVVVLLVAWMGMTSRSSQVPTITGLPGDYSTTAAPGSAPSAPTSGAAPAPGSAPGSAAPGSPAEPTALVVSVVGEVAHPGLVTLPTGARVADALAQANPHAHADTLSLNQAQRLEDGQQIVIHRAGGDTPSFIQGTMSTANPGGGSGGGDNPEAAGGPDAAGKVNINTATAAELETLPGVGEVTAAAIVSHRESIGAFNAIEQLLDVNGIGPAKFAQLENQVTL